MSGGRLRGVRNTGQQVYGAVNIPWGLNPSVASATCTLWASPALSACFSSNFVHALASNGCVRLSLYRRPVLCQVICFADSSVMYILWIRGMGGGTVGHSLGSFAVSLDDPHQSLPQCTKKLYILDSAWLSHDHSWIRHIHSDKHVSSRMAS
jgi:hypothetical protein